MPNENFNLTSFSEKINTIRLESAKALVGQKKMLDLILTAMFAGGHVLIEGVPGVAKTLTARLIASMTKTTFKRIQFTPDLMPSDILGTSIFDLKKQEFVYRKGPVFGNMILIDEINRAPAKAQASLFEVMEERQITNDGEVYKMDDVFMVLATQNPIEQEGTYRLPEAQLDRFIFKIVVDYPTLEEELQMLDLVSGKSNFQKLDFIEAVIDAKEIKQAQQYINTLLIKPEILKYITELVHQTRQHPNLYLGASPRASIDLMRSSKALAALNGREFVTPEDIQYLFRPVVAHRMVSTPESELQGITLDEICNQIIQQVAVPK